MDKKLVIIKGVSLLCSVVGMIGTAWVTDKENKLAIAKLVNEQLKK